jgi:hypothetical protein
LGSVLSLKLDAKKTHLAADCNTYGRPHAERLTAQCTISTKPRAAIKTEEVSREMLHLYLSASMILSKKQKPQIFTLS